MERSRTSGGGMVGMMLIALVGVAMLAMLAMKQPARVVQLGIHRLQTHPNGADVPAYFSNNCPVKRQGTAELYSPKLNQWMEVCFLSDTSLALWFLTDKLEGNGREITGIPPEDMKSPIGYTQRVIQRDGYELKSAAGAPEWFLTYFR